MCESPGRRGEGGERKNRYRGSVEEYRGRFFHRDQFRENQNVNRHFFIHSGKSCTKSLAENKKMYQEDHLFFQNRKGTAREWPLPSESPKWPHRDIIGKSWCGSAFLSVTLRLRQGRNREAQRPSCDPGLGLLMSAVAAPGL